MDKIKIGARASNLSLVQANIIKEELLNINDNLIIDIVPMSTKGDQRLDLNWKSSKVSLKGLFTTELEQALLSGEIDIAVHSLKDMPNIIHDGLCIAAYVNQADERDVFVSDKYNSVYELPIGGIIGTSSARREYQLLELRPDIESKIIRGNIETRINKMIAGDYDAIILAAAGLHRTANTKYLKQYFNEDEMLSACGQGILCLETKMDNDFVNQLLKKMSDENTTIIAKVERLFSAIFDSGCSTPLGCNGSICGEELRLKGVYFHKGKRYCAQVAGNKADYKLLAYKLANKLKGQYINLDSQVYLVGAGPGEVDLLTVKAYNLIKQCDCILYDRLINTDILKLARKDVKLIYVGKENHELGKSQALINQQIVNAAFKYKKVVRLKSGDSFIFGRAIEEISVLHSYNIKYELVPGISSLLGASNYSLIPLTERNCASSFHVFSGHNKGNGLDLDYQVIAKLDGTIIFFMSIKNIKEIVNNLVINGSDANLDIAFVENATTPNQRVVTCKLKDVINSDITSKVKAPAIVIIGSVVNFYKQFSWFNEGQKTTLLSTREAKHFNTFKQYAMDYGLNSISLPQIEIEYIKNDDVCFDKYEIILFNSVNGARSVDCMLIKDKIIGAVGIKTKQLLIENKLKVSIVPSEYNMETLIKQTIEMYPEKKILIIGSNQTQLDIQHLGVNSGIIDHYVSYNTLLVENEYDKSIESIKNSNVICFFSSSGVLSFLENINYRIELLTYKKIASIGKATTSTLNEYKIKVDIEAKVSTQEGLIDAINKYLDV